MTGSTPRDNEAATGHPSVGTEIERKFLVRDTGVVAGLAGKPLVQGYFADIDGWSVRLRTAIDRSGHAQAWLTLKSQDAGLARREIEALVDHAFASRLLANLSPDQLISKIRYRLPLAAVAITGGEATPVVPLAWEIDRFLERHHGLWLAEIELPRADYPLVLPDWIGPEVTRDPRYRNAALARAPGPSPQSSGGGSASPLQAPPAELVSLVRRLLDEAGTRPAGDDATGEAGLHA